MKKLKSPRGETLVETLASILIIVLTVGLLATAVLAAGKLNASTREEDRILQTQYNAAESGSWSQADTVTLTGTDIPETHINVYFSDLGDSLRSYRLAASP